MTTKHTLQTLLLLASTIFCAQAQSDSSWQAKPSLRFSGFMDVFYVYDSDQQNGSNRQDFLFNHNRHNEFNLNLGLLQFEVDHPNYRAKIGLQVGTYANDNYAAESALLQNVFEATVGIKLSDNNKWWLDAGILPSHIGFESAISMDNPTLTRSFAAENSPYFLAGARLSYKPSRKLEIAALITNGWQRIQRVEDNSLPSFGTQVNYSPNDGLTLNWSTFIGTDDPDDTRRMRLFSNLYTQIKVSDKFNITAGFDVGAQQESKGDNSIDVWYTPVLIGQLDLNERWKMGMRLEYFHDASEVIIITNTTDGFRTSSASVNLDFSPAENIVWRIEGRIMDSTDAIFRTKSGVETTNYIIATSLAIKLPEFKLTRRSHTK